MANQRYDGLNFQADHNTTFMSQAEAHAHRAEELLMSIDGGQYVITPVAASVAQVHATLALAYATAAGSQLFESPEGGVR